MQRMVKHHLDKNGLKVFKAKKAAKPP